uniref:Uncharacterized protein n=1 Tax=Lactuca sativa TaxID=4236 RepID=A0A9R1VPG7_LACSA|nr:hypothetical protein LSAT_V11C400214130 [Lactuca sativa]
MWPCRAISDILLNNICEVFNNKIIKGRDKPIIGDGQGNRPLTPTATTILDLNKSHTSHYIVRWNGGEKYQVIGAWQDQHVVDDVADIYRWVNKVYWLDTWKNAYSYKVEPIKGRIMWPKSLCPTTFIPPLHHKQVGNQSQSGIDSVSQEEGCKVGPDGVHKLTWKYVSVKCEKCKNKGQNSRECKGQGGGSRWYDKY